MSEKLHSIWPILALAGVGDAIGDVRPTFVVSRDGRFLHFANAAGARFLGVPAERALDVRIALAPRIAERLARFAAASAVGDTGRDLLRFFDGLRSTLLSVGFARIADDAVTVTVDNTRPVPADADPAASLAAIVAEGGLVALFDAEGDVVVARGDHTVLDGVQDAVEAALDADTDDSVFERRVVVDGRAHDLTLVRLGDGPATRRLLRVGPAVAVSADAVPPAPVVAAPPAPALPELPPPELPIGAAAAIEPSEDLALAVAAVTAPAGEPETVSEPEPESEPEATLAPAPLADLDAAPDEPSPPAEAIVPEAEPAASVDLPPVAEPEPVAAPLPADPTAETPDAAERSTEPFRYRPIGRGVKFVWQMDAERRFTLLSGELAEVVGPRATDVVGRTWQEVAEALGLDAEGRVTAALDRRDTWSGRTVLWPIEGEALRLPVDLAALPAFDRGRVFAGYRGFGTIRSEEPIPDPTATGLRLAELAPVPLETPDVPAPSAVAVAAEADETPEAPRAEHPIEATPVAPAARLAPSLETSAEVSATAPAPETNLPDLWLDDELAIAMATLPACAEDDLPPDASEPTADESAAAAEAEADEAPVPLADDTAARTVESTVQSAVEVAEADAVAPADPTEEVAAFDPPASPLALLAAEFADDESEPMTAGTADDAPEPVVADEPLAAPTPATTVPDDSVAETVASVDEPSETAAEFAEVHPTAVGSAPETLRHFVAEASEYAAEHEPRIILPARSHPEPAPEEIAADLPDAEIVPAYEPPSHAPIAAPAHPLPPLEPTVAATEPDPTPMPAVDLRDAAEASPAPEGDDDRQADEPSSAPASRIATLAATLRPAPETTRLSPPERVAFRQIAEALGARIEGEEPAGRDGGASSTDSRPATAAAAGSTSAATGTIDTRLLDRLPTAVAVVKDDDIVYGNEAFLRLLAYPDLGALEAEGGLDALFAGEHVARRWDAAPDGSRPVPVLARDGRVIPVDASVATIPWAGGSALMLTLTEVSPTLATPQADAEAEAEAMPSPAADVDRPPQVELTPSVADAPPPAAIASIAPVADTSALERVAELEAIIDTATDGVLMLDAEGTVLSANHAAEALFGTDRRVMIGRPLADRLAPESRRSAMDYLDGLARNGVASVLNDGREVIGVVEQGGLIPLFMTIGRISAEPTRKYCAVLRDITQWKKSEEDLTAARRRAEEASVHKSDFLAKISHEIRTPLNAIIGFSEVMMDERFGPIGNDRYKDYLRDIHSSGSHIMSLINDLLDLSKVEAGKMDLRFEAVTLADIVAECVAMMQPQANRERIIIRSSLPAGVPPVVADPRSVRQVVLNLLSNAIKFTPSGGQVIVSTTLEDNGEVVMRVRDTGYGMTDKELQTAMEPFRQLHTTRSRGGGTGLGLPLTKALVEANRAVFRIDSTVGQGTLVTVTFPVTRVLAS